MAAPIMKGTAPVGVAVAPNETIEAICTDDVQVVQATILVELTDPNGVTTTAINGGAFQGGYSGTITANGANGFDIVINMPPAILMTIGVWSAYAYCEDAGAAPDNDTWGWRVVADAPVVSDQEPIDIETDLTVMRATIRDDWGILVGSIGLSITAVDAQEQPIIAAGAFQTGWAGSIISLDDAGYGPREVMILVRSWPVLRQAVRYSFALDADTIVGTST